MCFVEGKYLKLPVRMGVEWEKILFRDRNGALVYELDVPLDPKNPAEYMYAEMTPFLGMELDIALESGSPYTAVFTDRIEEPAEKRGRKRPEIHFTTTQGWINDPNGFCYADGVYHLFYQYNPAATGWGNMHWGHAVSRDLLHWEEKDIALYPDETGTMFSGSAWVDSRNVRGLKTTDKTPILLFYTAAPNNRKLSEGALFTQRMAYTVDGGETFVKCKKTVIPHQVSDNRDPKVSWSKELGAYVLALYLTNCEYAIFRSDDLTSWEKFDRVDFPGDSECPDFYPLRADDGRILWVFSGAADYYLVGTLDERGYHPIQSIQRLGCEHRVKTYAAQTCSFPDGEDCGSLFERRIRIAWENMPMHGARFEGQMSIPTEMFLRKVGDTYRLGALPVRELDSVSQNEFENTVSVKEDAPLSVPLKEAAYDLTIRTEKAVDYSVTIFGATVEIWGSRNEIRMGEQSLPLRHTENGTAIRLIRDTASIEVFADDGLIYTAFPAAADYEQPKLILQSRESAAFSVKVNRLTV